MALDEATGLSISVLTNGSRYFVRFDTALQEAAVDPNRRVCIHHNHPDNGSLSHTDLTRLFERPGLIRVVAYGHDGSAFSAAEPARRMMHLLADARAATRGRLAGRLDRHEFDEGDADFLLPHLANESLQRLGAFRYDVRPSEQAQSIFQRNRRIIDLVLRDVLEELT